jgi:hypothetical protein
LRAKLAQLASLQPGYQLLAGVTRSSAGTHVLVQMRDVNAENGIAWDHLVPFIPDRKGVERYLLRDGDVLFLSKGARRVASVVCDPKPNAIAAAIFFILRVREGIILPEYLAWYLNGPAQREMNAEVRQGTTMPFLTREALENLEVALPSLDIQQVIVRLDATLKRERLLTTQLLDARTRLALALAERAIDRKEG